MKKQAIYARHGIQFKAGKMLYHGRWIPELLKAGNTKTGKRVYTFSLPAGSNGSCVCDCPGCYAKTGFYRVPSVCESLERNLEIVNNDIDFFYNAISAQLETIGHGEIRIHAAGDFNTNNPSEYAGTWKRIVIENPSFLFWTYTKMQEYETLFDETENGNIVKSIIDGIGYNFGHCDYILRVYAMLKKAGKRVYICRCGIDHNQHCEKCGHCSNTDFVLFVEHSTDYNAESDPAYTELKALIDSQE